MATTSYNSASPMVNRCILAVLNGEASVSDAANYVPQLARIVKYVLGELVIDPLISGADQSVIANQLAISTGDQQ